MGSLEPDSISSREAVFSLRFRFLDRRMPNTEAASVEPITEAVKRLSRSGSFKIRWIKSPVIPAVRTTPAADNSTDRPITGFAGTLTAY